MFAKPGDRLVVRCNDGLRRDAEIIEVAHRDGSPPYRVVWSDSGHEALVFPGPGAYVAQPTHDRTDRTEEQS